MDPLTGLSASRFGVYVHFPWCLSKCPYCDFASTVAPRVPQARYAEALRRELALRSPGLDGREVHSVYLGGGTPSLWDAVHVADVLDALAGAFQLGSAAEVTLEANPGAADAARFRDYRAAGVNRLSVGVQSFQPRTLAALGRAHGPEDARAAYRAARAAGFEDVSLDFIYGVQGQTLDEVRADAAEAAELGPEHLSAYALTLDAESLAEEVPLARALRRGEVALPDDGVVTSMQRAVEEAWARAGLVRYEVSNYARPGRHSRHNALYWTGGEYLALGAGATGFLVEGPGRGARYSNHRSAERWFQDAEAGRLPEAAREPLGPQELFAERVAMGLRLAAGVDLEQACARFGVDAGARQPLVRQLVAQGLAALDGGRVRLTARGLDVHSAIAARLM